MNDMYQEEQIIANWNSMNLYDHMSNDSQCNPNPCQELINESSKKIVLKKLILLFTEEYSSSVSGAHLPPIINNCNPIKI